MIKFFFIIFLLSPIVANASITLPWSTSFASSGCTEELLMGYSGANCDGFSNGKGSNVPYPSSSVLRTSANNPLGTGRGAITQINAGKNYQGSTYGVNFATRQTEYWCRFYIQYQPGFTWTTLQEQKLAWNDTGSIGNAHIFSLAGNSVRFWNQGLADEVVSGTSNGGWPVIGDGNWHCLEYHLKYGANGHQDAWVDGVRVINHDLSLTNENGGYEFIDFLVNADAPNASYWVKVDDIAISNTGYIGPLGGTPPPDSTPPVISNGSPSGTLAYGTTSTNMTVATNESATCKYGTSNVAYASLPNTFTTTGGTSHSQTLNGLTNGSAYTYYVRCMDGSSNADTSSTAISFNVSGTGSSDTTPPTISNGTPSGTLTYGTTSANMTVTTNETSTCKYGTSNVAYASLPSTFTTTGSTSHSQSLSGLTNGGSYTYYVRCIDGSGNADTSSSTISYSVSNTPSSSATLLFSEDFENSSFTSRGWYDGAMTALTSTTPQHGSYAAQFAFAQGATNPSSPYAGAMRHLFTATDELYVSFYIKFATGWRGSQQLYHPHQIFILSDLDGDYAGMANAYLDTYIEFRSDIGSPYAIRPQLAIQDAMRVNYSLGTPPNNLSATTENRSVGSCNTPVQTGATGDCYTTGGNYWWSADTWKDETTNVLTNAWHKVEAYFKMNTISGNIGQHDGIMQEWIDGTQVINRTNVLYRTNQDSTKKWHQFVIAPYIGDGSPIAQTFYIDNLNVWDGSPSGTSLNAVNGVTVISVTNP